MDDDNALTVLAKAIEPLSWDAAEWDNIYGSDPTIGSRREAYRETSLDNARKYLAALEDAGFVVVRKG